MSFKENGKANDRPKIFTAHRSDKGFVSKIYKKLLNNPIKIGTDTSPNKTYKWQRNTERMLNIFTVKERQIKSTMR